MPHVVIEAAGDLQALYQNFTPILQRTGGEILKIQEFYLSRSGKEALLEAVAIDQGTASNFFVQLKLHENAITVRLLPATDPEKTPAVKKVMALVARFIRTVYPESRYGKTNLQEYLASIDSV
ncbi:MAG TPA: hypothetical protein DDY39_13445 [Nitrospira sp.]|jgi:hypothetical protein|uniref:hypothetical protein n=1 Tax=Nitrospira sp. BLG_1 TaxID=3395883 RepID=UPI000E89B56C|nr:hypothetical protein [Nitrospira sp.]MBX3348385.1 hypothetical protein [Nitrospira sp.]HBH80826.1 hypothetical protein [Nitrospira sp.]HBR52495.1 hypothetical protein [Nitrospira sp.]